MIHLNQNQPAMDREEELLPARMLNEFVYCPRLFFLEHVDGLFAHNTDTIEGAQRHKRVDKKTDELKSGNQATAKSKSKSKKDSDDNEDHETSEREIVHARSVTLSSQHYGIIAKLDLVQATGNVATPVDYKRGSPRTLDDGTLTAWDPERVQLCAQALVLRENGYTCNEGVIFFWETRQRVTVPIDEELIAMTRNAIVGAQAVMQDRIAPPPLDASPKCPRCSLVGICLPDETSRCRSVDHEGNTLNQPLLFDIGPVWNDGNGTAIYPRDEIRTLITARDEKRPLYLNTQGTKVGKTSEVLTISLKDKVIEKIRMSDVSQINLMGGVQVSTQAIQTLLQLEIPLLYFTMGGWFYGMTQGVGLKNILWRREQFRMADSAPFCLRIARRLVVDKIRNQRTLLMRNHLAPQNQPLNFLKELAGDAERAPGLDQLLGIEGMAARTYFEHFSGMIKIGRSATDQGKPAAEASDRNGGTRPPYETIQDNQTSPSTSIERDDELLLALKNSSDQTPAWLNFDFNGRNRRPPRDPVNALLSLGYSLLAKDLTVICASVGLDPYLGYYHQPRAGRPALALDLMEPFRPLIVDSAVLSAINTKMVQPEHFISAGNAVALTVEGRKAFFRAYEQRMDQLVTHPAFGYRVSYRRVLEIQTRLLARVITGEIWHFPPFVTR